MSFTLPPIEDKALQTFCEKHDLFEAVAAGYHYAHKFFPKAQKIELDFYPPYRDDEPEEAVIDFLVKTDMTAQEVFDARHRFNWAIIQIPGQEYICLSHWFV